jgi:hypothetical protein
MLLEPKIGKLIRKMNPYTNGAMRTMFCGRDPTNLATLAGHLITLGTAINTYLGDMSVPNLQALETAEDNVDADLDLHDISVRVDNDYRQDYMTWTFRNQPYAVKRALRVTYRYELTDPPPGRGARTGIFGTEHVLIGYAGSNG